MDENAVVKKRITIRGSIEKDTVENIKKAFNRHIHFTLMRDKNVATTRDYYFALALTIRDQLIGRWIRTQQYYYDVDPKRVYYMSMEFNMGKFLKNILISLNCLANYEEAMKQLNLDLYSLMDQEEEVGLGNGGLGRLAACFLDSMTTVGIAGYGYGIRYNHGIFKQFLENGWQCESADEWLLYENPWEKQRPEHKVDVQFGGRVELIDERFQWVDTYKVIATPYDYPVSGFANNKVNTLRLWSAKAPHNLEVQFFNDGDYIRAVLDRNGAENISCVLYPNDAFFEGQELRLKQEYFLVAASLHDVVKRFKSDIYGRSKKGKAMFFNLPKKVAIQLNDSHPALAIPELMRILVDEEYIDWDAAWSISCQTFAYTNHTLMPEALERWPVTIFETLLPRHLQLIYHINHLHLEKVAREYPNDPDRIRRMSVFEEYPYKKINMAYLAIVGSHAVNGVAHLHSELLKSSIFKDFYDMSPEKFQNKTNGISPRRWILQCNTALADALVDKISNQWIINLCKLREIESFIYDQDFVRTIMSVKRENKRRLAQYIKEYYDKSINEDTLFDIHVKRINEYKRQLLNCLHVITKYCRIKYDKQSVVARTVIIGGKAAPGYKMAKLIIKFINNVALVINNDNDVGDQLKLIFLENYCVSLAEIVIPAAELSEQISTAGTEASGTGSMKFMANGALTIGTLDGANIEMAEEVGQENMFIFGHCIDEVNRIRENGYDPSEYYQSSNELRRTLDLIKDGFFSPEDPSLFTDIFNNLYYNDEYLLLADFQSYMDAQDQVEQLYKRPEEWTRKAILNISACGKFSSDRTVREYCRDIWNAELSETLLRPNL